MKQRKKSPLPIMANEFPYWRCPSDRSKRRVGSFNLLLVLLLAGLTGCASLPKVGPFVDASNQLRSAVAASGATVEAELRLIPGGTTYADQLKTNWVARNQAFAGIAQYAKSLQSIVDAGNQGAVSAQKVADSVKDLAQAAGVALPGAGAAGVVTDAGKLIYTQIALIRAAKSLERAMEDAQPAVESITHLIAADLQNLDAVFVAASTANANAVRTSDEFANLLGYRTQVLKRIGTCDPTDSAALSQQAQLGQMLQATEDGYSKYLAKRKEIDDRLRAGRALIQTAIQGATDWGVAHSNLITALKERRPVNTDSLVQAAAEIQNLVRKVREL